MQTRKQTMLRLVLLVLSRRCLIVTEMWHEADEDGSGELDLDEFANMLLWTGEQLSKPTSQSTCRRADTCTCSIAADDTPDRNRPRPCSALHIIVLITAARSPPMSILCRFLLSQRTMVGHRWLVATVGSTTSTSGRVRAAGISRTKGQSCCASLTRCSPSSD